VEGDGEPAQRVLPPAAFVLPHVDLAALPAGPREAEAARLAAAAARRRFDLGRGALLAALLLRLAPRRHPPHAPAPAVRPGTAGGAEVPRRRGAGDAAGAGPAAAARGGTGRPGDAVHDP